MSDRLAPQLNRSIGLLQATALVAGTMIGASIFVQPAEIARHAPSIAGILGAWLGAGLLTLFGALVCAELAAAFPRTGGVYVFLRETCHPALGFLWGWAMFWSMHTGIIAATAVVFARYAAYLIPMDDAGIRATAIGGIAAVTMVNLIGVRHGSLLQTVVTIAKVAAIAVILAVIASFAPAAPPAGPAPPPLAAGGLLLAIGAGLFAFGGWHMVTYAAGETRDPGKTIPRALLLGTLIVTVCYCGLNAAYLRVLPLAQVIGSTRVAADAAEVVAGPRSAVAVSLLVMVSAAGVMNGATLSGPRVYLAMASEIPALKWMGAIHPVWRTPHWAILAQGLWAAVLVATGTYRALFTRVIYTEWLFFALMAIGLLRLRSRQAESPSRLRIPAAIPALFAAASLAVVARHIAADPLESATGLALVLLGWPLFVYSKRGNPNRADR